MADPGSSPSSKPRVGPDDLRRMADQIERLAPAWAARMRREADLMETPRGIAKAKHGNGGPDDG